MTKPGGRSIAPIGAAARLARMRLPALGALTIALLGLGIVARLVRYGLNFPLWGDEAFLAVNFLLRDFRGMIEPLVYGQIAPLAFMWVELAVTRVAGLSEWALRFVPFLSGLLTLVLFWRFVRKHFGPGVTLLAVGILAASYYPIRHAVEVKPYATDLLVSLLLTMAGWAVYSRPGSIWRWVVLIVLAGACVWSSYPAVFVVGGVGVLLALLVHQRRTAGVLVGCIAYAAIVAASFGAMYRLYAKPHADAVPQLKDIEMWTETFPPIRQPWLLPWWFVEMHTGNMMAYPMGGKNFGSTGTFVLVAVGAVVLWRGRRFGGGWSDYEIETHRGIQRSRRALVVLLLSPLAFNFVAAAAHAYPYGGTARTSLFMAPAFCLLAAVGGFGLLAMMPYPHRQRGIRIIAGVLGVMAFGCMVRDLIEPYKKPETSASRQAIRDLAKEVEQGDRVIVFLSPRAVLHAPFILQAKGMGAQLAFYAMNLLPVGMEDFAPPLEDVRPSASGRTWLVVFYRDDEGRVIPSERELRQYLEGLRAQLGPCGEPRRCVLKDESDDEQRIDVYCFSPSQAQTVPRL